MKIDNPHNLAFRDYLNAEISKGNKDAELTKILFDAQKGINAIDNMSNKINLAKGYTEHPGKGVYPEDLSKEEFHKIKESHNCNHQKGVRENISNENKEKC